MKMLHSLPHQTYHNSSSNNCWSYFINMILPKNTTPVHSFNEALTWGGKNFSSPSSERRHLNILLMVQAVCRQPSISPTYHEKTHSMSSNHFLADGCHRYLRLTTEMLRYVTDSIFKESYFSLHKWAMTRLWSWHSKQMSWVIESLWLWIPYPG